MIKKLVAFILLFHIIVSCGFSPTLKVSSQSQTDLKVFYEVKDSSYIAQDVLRDYLQNTNITDAEYHVILQVHESESAVNIDSNGSVLEYKVEILIKYQISIKKNGEVIHKSQSRGLSNYDVSTSEYNNNLIKNEAIKTAVNEAAQLMNIMVQSKITE